MTCEHCQVRDATIHYQEYVNGSQFQIHLCQTCAQQLGIARPDEAEHPFGEGPESPAEQLWSQFFGLGPTTHQVGGLKSYGETRSRTQGAEPIRCPDCKMSLQDFAGSSLLGCATCYRTFKESLDPVLKRMQAGNRHVGRRMSGSVTPVADAPTEEAREQDVSEAKNQSVATDSETVANRYQRLRAAQDAAVAAEDYEEAARIRDRIRALDSEQASEDPAQGGETDG